MNKKVWVGFIAAYITFMVLDFVIHEVILKSTYMAESMKQLWRPPEEQMWWMTFIINAVFAFFFSFIFSKGYEAKGIAEGVRYGLYIGLMFTIPMAYGTYAFMPIEYSLALQWFIYGMIEMILAGIVLALVYDMKPKAAAPPSS